MLRLSNEAIREPFPATPRAFEGGTSQHLLKQISLCQSSRCVAGRAGSEGLAACCGLAPRLPWDGGLCSVPGVSQAAPPGSQEQGDPVTWPPRWEGVGSQVPPLGLLPCSGRGSLHNTSCLTKYFAVLSPAPRETAVPPLLPKDRQSCT